MSLEQRLRAELDRAAPASIPDAPAVDTMRAAVAGRRRRNRVLGGLAGAVVVVAVSGAIVASRDDATVEVATAGGAEATATTPPSAAAEGEADAPGVAGGVDGAEQADAVGEQGAEKDLEGSIGDEMGITTRLLEASTPVVVETRPSTVDFAGGSGVFVVATDDGYGGIAGRFGGSGGITMIGLASEDGLDWTEVGVSGIPAGATATHLSEFDGSYVALFSRFDPAEQRNVVTLATSADLANWTSEAVLPDDVVASDLAVGPAGVLIVGDGREPDVWAGPLTGPLERVGSIDGAVSVVGVVPIDDGFVAAGTADGVPTLFESTDGAAWSSLAMSGLADDDAVVEVAVVDGAIMIAGGGERAWTAASADGGQTWTRSELDASSVETVAASGRSMSFLGTSLLGTQTITLTDGSTWSSADLDIASGDRVELLSAGDPTILLAAGEDGLTWIVATR